METNKKPRCRQKIMLPETLALRKIREILNLDHKSAAILVEKSAKQLEKIENGFVELTPCLTNKENVHNFGEISREDVHNFGEISRAPYLLSDPLLLVKSKLL